MTIIEKKSERKKKAIKLLVENGEYSVAYAIMLAEELNDAGKLLDADYEELVEWLENIITPATNEEGNEVEENNEEMTLDGSEDWQTVLTTNGLE